MIFLQSQRAVALLLIEVGAQVTGESRVCQGSKRKILDCKRHSRIARNTSMNPYRTQLLITTLLAALLTTTASARPLDFSELSLLVRAHEPEASVIADAKERKLMHALTPQQEATLKAQGASDSLIQSLRNSNVVVSQPEAAAYEANRAAAARIPAPFQREASASQRPN